MGGRLAIMILFCFSGGIAISQTARGSEWEEPAKNGEEAFGEILRRQVTDWILPYFAGVLLMMAVTIQGQ